MRRIISVGVLVLVLLGLGWVLTRRGFGQKLGAPPAELATEYKTEEAWLVGEVTRDVTEMTAYARGHRGEPDRTRLVLTHATEPPAWTARVTLPEAAEVTVSLPLPEGPWSSEGYRDYATRLITSAGLARPPVVAPAVDEALLTHLLDLRATTIEEENGRVSALLASGPTNPDTHEAAAIVLGGFALREAAGHFQDLRQVLCRMTAHLALAGALRASDARSRDGEIAAATLLVLTGRTADALPRLDRLAARPGSPAGKAWSRALRVRATNDWRLIDQPRGASLLERLAYFRAVRATGNRLRARALLESPGLEPVADWSRISIAETMTVEEGNVLLPRALSLEMDEMQSVRLRGGSDAIPPKRTIAALNERATRCVTSAGPRVIGWGMWAAFFQRHIAHYIPQAELHHEYMLGRPEQAETVRAEMDRQWMGLDLFPVASCLRERDGEQSLDRIGDAIALAVRAPELVAGFNWIHLERGSRYEPLRRGMPSGAAWFTTGLPRGSVYDTRGRYGYPAGRLETLPFDTASLAALARSNPYDTVVAAQRQDLLPAAQRGSLAALVDLYGPRAEFDLGVLDWLSRSVVQPTEKRTLLERECGLDADACLRLAASLHDAGQTAEGVTVFKQAVARHADAVGVTYESGWVALHYLEHGRPEKALRLAREAAAVGSLSGQNALGFVLEKMERFEEADAPFRAAAEQYDDYGALVAFHYRMARVRKAPSFAARLRESERHVFPSGLHALDPKSLTAAPAKGVFINGHNAELLRQDLRAGDIIVALDGWQVEDPAQYFTVRAFTDSPDMGLTVWRGGYREVKAHFPGRKLNVDVVGYPQKGWVRN